MPDPIKKKLQMDFDQAVKRVEEVLTETGFSHMMSKPIHRIIEEHLSVDFYEKYTIILACAPELAKMALDVSRDSGLLFPCSFSVYEEEGEVWLGHISIMKIAPEIGLAPADRMAPVINRASEMVQSAWEKI